MLIVYALALLGIFRFRSRSYWQWLSILFAWMLSASLLFNAGGTLEDPSGDGLITRQIRIAANDGPELAVFGIAFLVIYWGSVIWIIRKMYLTEKTAQAEFQQQSQEADSTVGIERKIAETFLTTTAAAVYIYVAFIMPIHNGRHSEDSASLPGPASSDRISSQLTQEANELNKSLPKKVDDVTTLVSASVSGRTFIYNYDVSAKDITPLQLKKFVAENVVKSACDDKSMNRAMKDFDVTYRYSYTLPGISNVTEVDVNFAGCSSVG
jgi:hypothetical protein